MPQLAIAEVILKATLALKVAISVKVAMAVAAVVQFVAITAASMGANKLLSPKQPSFSDASLSDRTQMVRSPIAARQIIYGQTKVSGVMVYISTTGTKNEYLHLVIALAGHEVEEIGDVYFNDELALTGVGSSASGRFTGYADIYKKLGASTQTVETNLVSATSALTNGKWTSAHRLRGIAYVYVRLLWSEQIWVGGIPNISAIVKGKKVYDPRTLGTAYSANSALCLRDYLMDATYGLGMDSSEIDNTAFIAAANVCDEQVEVKPVTSPATNENRYETNGVLFTSSSPDENIGKLLTAMGGLIAYSAGSIVPYAAGYRIPTITLDESDFVGPVNIQTKVSSRDRVNSVKGVFVSSKSEWQPTDFPSQSSTTYVSQDNSVKFWRDVALPMTTSSSAAQRIARIELFRARQEITLGARFRLDAMQLRAGDTVMITNAKFGWSSKVFEVLGWTFVASGEPPQLAIEMTLKETASSVYDWSTSDEIVVDTTPTTTLPNPFSVAAPTALALTADGTTQLVQADGTAIPRIQVSWSAPANEFVQSGGVVVIEYKQSTATTYLTWSKVGGDQTLDFISSDVKIGLTYNVRIFGESYFQVATSYLTASVLVAKDTTAPAIPTGLTASVGTGKAVSLDWADNTEADFSEYGIYRQTTSTTPANANTSKIAEVRASRFVDTEVTIGTTYFYWINAYDSLENVSGFAASVQAIPTTVGGTYDGTAPNTPNAPSFISQSAYIASDGTALSRVAMTAPAMPTLGASLEMIYKRSSATNYLIGTVLYSGGVSFQIDDLSVGEVYDFAARAVSTYNVPSAISTTMQQTIGAPVAPPVVSIASITHYAGDSNGFSASVIYQGEVAMASARSSWDAVVGANIVGYDCKTWTDSITISPTISGLSRVVDPTIITGSIALIGEYLWIRSVDRNGTVSTFVTDGTNLNTKWAYPAGVFDIERGGTGASTTADALENLLPSYTTNGTKFLGLNIGATDVEWITGGGGSGTVISVAATGTVNGIALTGTVTTAGFLTLGGTLTNVSLTASVTGVLAIANGGTSASTTAGARTALGLGTAATANLSALGVITVDKMNFTSGDPVANIDENYGITLNGDATHPVRVVGAALAMGDFDLGNALTVGRIYLAEDRSIYALGTDLVYDYGSGSVSIPAGIGSGTVTSVSATGTVNGLTLTGEVTTAGFLTLSGAITDVNLNESVTGTLGVARGGTGSTDGTGARENLGLGTSASVLFGNINTGGLSKLGGNVSVTGNITATGDVSVTGSVNAVGAMSMGSGFSCVGSGMIASGGLSVDGNISAAVITATTRIYSPSAAIDSATVGTLFFTNAEGVGSFYMDGFLAEIACVSGPTPLVRMLGLGSSGGMILVSQNATGGLPSITISGSDGRIYAKELQFGVYAQSGGLSVTGYITVKDNNGIDRKLAVVV